MKHIVGRLADICKKEEVQLDEGELVEIAKASGGGFRDAETLLEQVITGGEKVSDLVGRATPENLEEFFDFLIAGDTATALIYVNDLYDKGVSMESFNQKVLEYLRDLLLIKVGVGESLVEVGKERFTKMQTQATSLPPQQLSNMINKFTQSYENLAQSSIPTLPLEVAVVGVVGATVEEGAKAQNESDQQLGDTKPLSAEVAKPDDQWQELKQRVKPLNHSVAALLRSCEPGKVNGRKFVIHAFYPFHKERLEEPKNRAILEEMVEAVYGKKLKLQVVLGKEVGSGE